jgi:hypothetical protein
MRVFREGDLKTQQVWGPNPRRFRETERTLAAVRLAGASRGRVFLGEFQSITSLRPKGAEHGFQKADPDPFVGDLLLVGS